LAAEYRVLVVDACEETHEVLRTALGDQGVDVIAARDSAHGLSLTREHRPNLIVFDLEAEGSTGIAVGLAAESAAQSTPLLVLGTTRRDRPYLAGCEFVRKPYHYAPLIRIIEELLGEVVDGARRRVAKAA
jgi:DNA-binding response OmpR family regulator